MEVSLGVCRGVRASHRHAVTNGPRYAKSEPQTEKRGDVISEAEKNNHVRENVKPAANFFL